MRGQPQVVNDQSKRSDGSSVPCGRRESLLERVLNSAQSECQHQLGTLYLHILRLHSKLLESEIRGGGSNLYFNKLFGKF